MSLKLLVVDDSAVPRAQIANFLEETDYKIDMTESANAAIELINKNEYDIVITDKNMPGFDEDTNEGGMDLLKFIKKNKPEIEVLMMTGYATIETALEAMKIGAFDYIIKPFKKDELIDSIDRVKEYKTFLNPEYIIDMYKKIQNEIIDLFSEKTDVSDEERHKKIKSLNSKIDIFFKTQKNWERVILIQRDALASITNHASKLVNILTENNEALELVEKILEEADQRL